MADDMTPEQRRRFLDWATAQREQAEASLDEWLSDLGQRVEAFAEAAKAGSTEYQAIAELMRIVHSLRVQLHALRRRVDDLELWKAQHGG